MYWGILEEIKRMWQRMAMRISNIAELDGVKHENFKFAVEGNILKVTNSREKIEFNIEFNEGKRLKTVKTIEKYTGLKLELTQLTDREILAFVEDKGFNKVMWNPIGKAMHKYNMVEAGDRIAVGVSGGKDSMTLINALVRIKKIVKANKNGDWFKTTQKRKELIIPSYIKEELAMNKKAQEFFNSLAKSYKRNVIMWITSAKKEETRKKRLTEAITLLTQNKKLGMK